MFLIKFLTTSITISGVLAVAIGGASFLCGVLAIETVELGKLSSFNRPQYQKMILYGTASVGAGLFLTGAALWIASFGEQLAIEEMRRIEEQTKKQNCKLSVCEGCKHFHGVHYNSTPLICAMHPYGVEGEHCPDWEA
ncbi:hypothetical protein BZZ01_18250 [Nostocales cyanobacterium HT-58-2]|nr:hypothetical protein BZZ01_18250 [Nostocales cyanobacterium HT-58-2]